ncbi:MAG: hypothetical protein GYB68_19940 [Chloroflexi bacterium]|nr:hypothetical protein [Chloroflexota bacterium]
MRTQRFWFLVAVLLLVTGCGSPAPTTPALPAATESEEASPSDTGPDEEAPTEAQPAEPTEVPPTATPEGPFPGEGPWEVNFESADGVELGATVYGQGEQAVILTHDFQRSQADWQAFAQQVAEQGYRTLTLDFRG